MYVALANLTNGGLSGGSRKYLEVVTPMLANHSKISRLDLFAPPQAVAGLRATTGLPWESWSSRDSQRGFRELRSELRARQPDVVFVPSARWIDCGSPVVAMIRNMEPLAVPFAGNPWLEAIRTLARRWVAKKVCRKADSIIAVSDFVREFLVEKWRLKPTKITTIYHGIDLLDNKVEIQRPAALAGLTKPFLFTAGSIRPYRGLEDAVGALPAVLQQRRDLVLVIGGETEVAMLPYRHRLQRQAESLGCADRILWCGKLSQTEMSWCFRQCGAFLMTSRVEACPNIVLEAMAHSCLSVSTNSPPMPEMYDATALYYSAGDCNEMANQIQSVLSLDSKQRQSLQAAAKRRASDFTWEKTVDETVAELLRTVGEVKTKMNSKSAA